MRFPARSPETQTGIATRAATRPCASRSLPGHVPPVPHSSTLRVTDMEADNRHTTGRTDSLSVLLLVDTDGALCYNDDGVAWASRPAVTRLTARIETSD